MSKLFVQLCLLLKEFLFHLLVLLVLLTFLCFCFSIWLKDKVALHLHRDFLVKQYFLHRLLLDVLQTKLPECLVLDCFLLKVSKQRVRLRLNLLHCLSPLKLFHYLT